MCPESDTNIKLCRQKLTVVVIFQKWAAFINLVEVINEVKTIWFVKDCEHIHICSHILKESHGEAGIDNVESKSSTESSPSWTESQSSAWCWGVQKVLVEDMVKIKDTYSMINTAVQVIAWVQSNGHVTHKVSTNSQAVTEFVGQNGKGEQTANL
jgi:hypothetical protein